MNRTSITLLASAVVMSIVAQDCIKYIHDHRVNVSKPTPPIRDTDKQDSELRQMRHDVQVIESKYHVTHDFAIRVVKYAYQYSNKDFPTAHDVLAIVSIESSFRPNVKSKLKKDKAVGLTQIRPKVWNHLIPTGALDSVENQIKYGSVILTHYYKVLGDKNSAANAYNVGLTNHINGKRNDRYVSRFTEARMQFL